MQAASWTKLAAGVAAVLAVCLLAGYFLAPGIVGSKLAAAILQHTGQTAVFERISVNPFTLTATISNLRVGQTAGWSAQVPRITLRFSPVQLVAAGWRLRAVNVDAPRIRVPAGTRALHDGFASFSPEADLEAGLVSIADGEMVYGSAAGYRLTALAFELRELAVGHGRAGRFTLEASVDKAGKVFASGSLGLSPSVIDARVVLADIDVGKLRANIDASNDLVLKSARLGGEMRLRVDESESALTGELTLEDVDVVNATSNARVFSAAKVLAGGLVIAAAPQTASIETLTLSGPLLRLTRVADRRWSNATWLAVLAQGPAGLVPPVRRIDIVDGRLDVIDFATSPSVRFNMDAINGKLAQADDGATASISLTGRPTPASLARLSATWSAADLRRNARATFGLEGMDATQLSPYFEKLFGRSIEAGQLDLSLTATLAQGVLTVDDSIEITGFTPGAGTDEAAPAEVPLEFVIAVLQDTDNQIHTSVPVPAVPLTEGADPLDPVRIALTDYLLAVATRPFEALEALAGIPADSLSQVGFDAGNAALSDEASAQLEILATVLHQRPGIGILVNGHYDPVADRRALAEQQMRLHVALATSEGPPGRKTAEPVDLANTRVRSILDEFAAKRLSVQQQATLRAATAGSKSDYYLAVYKALVANESVSTTTLASLARFRARAVVAGLISTDIDAGRVRANPSASESRAEDGIVPVALEVTLAPVDSGS